MLKYTIQRLFLSALIVVIAVTLMFIMIRSVPGDPVSVMLGPRATPDLKAQLIEQMGLNDPLPLQISYFFGNLLAGDMGVDVFSNRQVSDIVFEQLPYTLELIFCSIIWSATLGVFLGVYAAARRDSLVDRITAFLSVACVAAPAFVVALLGLLLFAVRWQWFPAIGAGDPEHFSGRLSHLVLPSFAIGLSWVGYVARLVRASMLEVMVEPHIRTARAFGLPEWRIVLVYALRVAILPVVTVIGVGMGFLLSQAVFTEIIFARPGIGKLVIDSITTRNYPVVMGGVLISTVVFVCATAAADIINAVLDPRARTA